MVEIVYVNDGPQGKDWLEFRLHDRGLGMPDKIRACAFTPLWLTEGDSNRGRGFGLAIVHRHVEENDGLIDINNKSKFGNGMQFRIAFPIHHGE